MSQNAAFDDASIPVLTEVVQEKAAAAGSVPAPAAVPAVPGSRTDQEWSQLEQRLAEGILQQLQSRVDFVLEQRLRDSMADVIQQAIAGLADEIREGLQQTIEQIVVRAVAQELAHLKT
jgi:hypothetical protein